MSFKQIQPNPPIISHRSDVSAPIYWKVEPLLIIIIHSLSSQSNAYIEGIISESHLSKFCCEQCWAMESPGLAMRVLWAAASLAHSWGTTGHFQASHHQRDWSLIKRFCHTGWLLQVAGNNENEHKQPFSLGHLIFLKLRQIFIAVYF